MRKIALMMLLAVVCGSATAAWVKVSVSDAGTGYVDPATIRRTGDKITMTELTDYKIVPDATLPYKSVKRQYEFDCKEMTMRALTMSAFSGPMGKGDADNTASTPSSDWMSVIAGSVGEIMWRVACRKRGRLV
jgi:hypothetical protein